MRGRLRLLHLAVLARVLTLARVRAASVRFEADTALGRAVRLALACDCSAEHLRFGNRLRPLRIQEGRGLFLEALVNARRPLDVVVGDEWFVGLGLHRALVSRVRLEHDRATLLLLRTFRLRFTERTVTLRHITCIGKHLSGYSQSFAEGELR